MASPLWWWARGLVLWVSRQISQNGFKNMVVCIHVRERERERIETFEYMSELTYKHSGMGVPFRWLNKVDGYFSSYVVDAYLGQYSITKCYCWKNKVISTSRSQAQRRVLETKFWDQFSFFQALAIAPVTVY